MVHLFNDLVTFLTYCRFVPTSQYELVEGWALICLLLAIGSLEAIPIRISAFELTRPLRLSANFSDIQLVKAHNRFLMRSYWSDMARIFAVFVSCTLLGGGMLIFYAKRFTPVWGGVAYELLLYHFHDEYLLLYVFILPLNH